MSRRSHRWTARCAEGGCDETAFSTFTSVRELVKRQQQQIDKPWRCLRHDGSSVVLAGRTVGAEFTTPPVREESYGRFFGNAGFLYGPGFKVWAKDWPVGTRVRIRAEIIPPKPLDAPRGETP